MSQYEYIHEYGYECGCFYVRYSDIYVDTYMNDVNGGGLRQPIIHKW